MSQQDISGRLDDAMASVQRDGYAVIREVVPIGDVEQARTVCDKHLLSDSQAETEIEATVLLQLPELWTVIFNEQTIGALTSLLGGTLAYYPNYVVRLNRFTTWHVDNGFVPKFHGETGHLYDPGFRHLQCAVYLQDNVPGAGGGLDVRPRSHNWARDGAVPDYGDLTEAYPEVRSVDSRAGDLVVFDGRLMHRGTPTDGSLKRRKYGIFWSASRHDVIQERRYVAYLAGRSGFLRSQNPSSDYDYMLRRYDNVHAVDFPESYSPEAADLIRKRGIHLPEIQKAG